MAGNINKAYQWTINTCNDGAVGYSQDYRNQQTVNGVTYYDCSSLMWYALKAGGWDVASAYTGPAVCFRTWEMADTCRALGFNILDARTEIWKPGDILVDDWRPARLQHTEMVYEGPPNNEICMGKTMGAHSNVDDYGRPLPLKDQVSINNYYTYPNSDWNHFNRLIRWGSGGASGYGASKYVVAAICGNWWRESLGLSPGVYEGLNVVPLKALVYGGYGLGQWTNSQNQHTGKWNLRRTHLAEFLDQHGYEYDDGYGQLDFFLHEVDGTTGIWQAAGYGAKWADIYPTFESFMTSKSTDLLELTEAFLNCWEVGTTGLDIRYGYAQQALEIIENQGNMHPLEWISGNRYLEEPETLNNCLLIWDYLSAGGGGGGKLPYYSKSTFPLWMMINYKLI